MFPRLLSRVPAIIPRLSQATLSRLPTIPTISPTTSIISRRWAAVGGSPFMPKRRKFKKAQKGRVTVGLGNSTRGEHLTYGEYGIRTLQPHRFTARQLDSVRNTIRRVLKQVKGLKVYMRVFPDIPVTSKGTEVRMGKGKGSVDYWATRVRPGRILFEIKGELGLTEEMARQAIKAAAYKMPVRSEFVKREAAQLPTIPPPQEQLLIQESQTRLHPRRRPRLPNFVRKYNLQVPEALKAMGYKVEDLLPDPRIVAHVDKMN